MAVELERRGHGLDLVSATRDAFGHTDWKPSRDGQLTATINGHSLAIRFYEKGVGSRGDWKRSMTLWEQNRRNPRVGLNLSCPAPFDQHGTGELNMSVLGYSDRQTSWGDRQRWRLEDRLGCWPGGSSASPT